MEINFYLSFPACCPSLDTTLLDLFLLLLDMLEELVFIFQIQWHLISKIIAGDYGRYQGDNRLHKLIRRLMSEDERDSRSSAVKSLREFLYQSDNRVSDCTLPGVNDCN